MVTAQIIMGFTPSYKAAGSPLKFLSEQLYLQEKVDNSVLNRLGNAVGGIFGRTADERESAKNNREKDGRSTIQRWWDGMVSWMESLFDSGSMQTGAAAWEKETLARAKALDVDVVQEMDASALADVADD